MGMLCQNMGSWGHVSHDVWGWDGGGKKDGKYIFFENYLNKSIL